MLISEQLLRQSKRQQTMRPATHLAAFVLPFVLTAPLHGAILPKVHFTHHDWELACDNTRTCRAAAYSAADEEEIATVLFTRAAGPDQPVRAQLQLGHYNASQTPPPIKLEMSVDGRNLGTLEIDRKTQIAELSPAQTNALFTAVSKNSEISWTGDGHTWSIATKGADATLLKMDEFQGRLETPGALVRKGNKPETGVLPPLPVPEIKVASMASSDPHLVAPGGAWDLPALVTKLKQPN
jgi:hypothetical protein